MEINIYSDEKISVNFGIIATISHLFWPSLSGAYNLRILICCNNIQKGNTSGPSGFPLDFFTLNGLNIVCYKFVNYDYEYLFITIVENSFNLL